MWNGVLSSVSLKQGELYTEVLDLLEPFWPYWVERVMCDCPLIISIIGFNLGIYVAIVRRLKKDDPSSWMYEHNNNLRLLLFHSLLQLY